MATIKVKLRPSSVPGKAGTIVYQLIHRRKVRLLTTGIHVLPRYWDAASGGISGGPSSVAQSLIDSDVMLLRGIVGTLEHTGRPYTVDDIASRFHTGIAKPTFVSFMEQEIRLLADAGKLGTARNCRNTLASFTAFLQGRPLPFSALTAELVDNYSHWLSRRGLSRNSVSFYMRVLRSVYNKAVGQQLASQTFPFRNVYTGIDRTRKRAVPESVIARLLALDLPACSSLAFARDLFIFSYCMRGMAFVDMAYLRRTSIRGSHLRYFRHKTGQPLEIRLEKIPRNIVDRYCLAAPQSPYVFPILKTEEPQAAYRQYQTALGIAVGQPASPGGEQDEGQRKKHGAPGLHGRMAHAHGQQQDGLLEEIVVEGAEGIAHPQRDGLSQKSPAHAHSLQHPCMAAIPAKAPAQPGRLRNGRPAPRPARPARNPAPGRASPRQRAGRAGKALPGPAAGGSAARPVRGRSHDGSRPYGSGPRSPQGC